MQLLPVIMAGGTGSRLWPLSRELKPKQFLPLLNPQRSMLQATIDRLTGLPTCGLTVICNEEHRFLAAEQLRTVSGAQGATLLLEPVGRNTAPAIALAALQALSQAKDPQAQDPQAPEAQVQEAKSAGEQASDGLARTRYALDGPASGENASDVLLLVLAADHLIEDVAAFQTAVHSAIALAQAGKLVTFGVVASSPETGYGYIERGEALSEHGFAVARFVEKPDLETAKAYLDSGRYYWNSGMFLMSARTYLQELQRLQPQMVAACRKALEDSRQDFDFLRVGRAAFEACPSISVDYAVMEHTHNAAVVPLHVGWSDVGSWSSLWAACTKDAEGNACRGDVIAHNTHNSFVHAESRLVATVGLQNMVIVETADAVLVAHQDQVQEVKKVVEHLKSQGRTEHLNHREVYRPWGMYDSIDQGPRYQVKRITVKPGGKLSVQMHHHRAEHWIVVSGTAQVTKGDQTLLLTENQSTYIPVGQVHSLENPGVIPLELIEVQSGSYLGEDDIVRFQDLYGRAPVSNEAPK